MIDDSGARFHLLAKYWLKPVEVQLEATLFKTVAGFWIMKEYVYEFEYTVSASYVFGVDL